jgi:hypothetical protein
MTSYNPGAEGIQAARTEAAVRKNLAVVRQQMADLAGLVDLLAAGEFTGATVGTLACISEGLESILDANDVEVK